MDKRITYLLCFLLWPVLGYGMHISEGFLPVEWAVFWFIVYIPFFYWGIRNIKKYSGNSIQAKMLLAVIGAFVFILSSLKLPSVGGSSSHLTGIALGAIMFGASTMSVVGVIALLFQALLLAHGGLTTLGANAFSMTVVGAFVAVWIYSLGKKFQIPQWMSIFLAAFLSNITIYLCTSFQLAVAFQAETAPFAENLAKFTSVFAITQLPLAVIEGVFTVMAFRLIMKYSKTEILLINKSFQ